MVSSPPLLTPPPPPAATPRLQRPHDAGSEEEEGGAPPADPGAEEPDDAAGWLTGRRFRLAVYGALLLVQLTNAAYNLLAKEAISKKGANPLIFSLFRDALAYPLLQGGALLFEGGLVPERGDLPRIFALGLFGMFGNQFFFILGLVYIDATIASTINLLTPVCTWVVATSIGLERFSWLQLVGVALGVVGAMAMTGLGTLLSDGGAAEGDLAILCSCVTMGTYYVLQKPLVRKYPPVTLTAWSYAAGALVMGLGALLYVPWTEEWGASRDPLQKHDDGSSSSNSSDDGSTKTVLDAWDFPEEAWIAVASAVILNSILKYCLATFCNRHLSATVVSIGGTIVPIFTAAGDYIFRITTGAPPLRYLAALAVLAGLALVVRGRRGGPMPEVGPCRARMRLCIAGVGMPEDAPLLGGVEGKTLSDDDDDDGGPPPPPAGGEGGPRQ